MVNRERKLVQNLVTDFSCNYNTIDETIETLQQLKEQYGGSATLAKYTEAYSDSEYIGVYVMVPETDKQYTERIAYEEKAEASKAERDRAEYERLKKQFES